MAYIPLHAQREIAALSSENVAAMRTKMLEQIRSMPKKKKKHLPLPKRMEVGVDSPSYTQQFDVYFKREGTNEFIRQTACEMADSVKGVIRRYTKARGSVAQSDETETLHGEVRFELKQNDD